MFGGDWRKIVDFFGRGGGKQEFFKGDMIKYSDYLKKF